MNALAIIIAVAGAVVAVKLLKPDDGLPYYPDAPIPPRTPVYPDTPLWNVGSFDTPALYLEYVASLGDTEETRAALKAVLGWTDADIDQSWVAWNESICPFCGNQLEFVAFKTLTGFNSEGPDGPWESTSYTPNYSYSFYARYCETCDRARWEDGDDWSSTAEEFRYLSHTSTRGKTYKTITTYNFEGKASSRKWSRGDRDTTVKYVKSGGEGGWRR